MHQADYDDDGGSHMGLVSVAAATIAVLAIGVGGSYWTGRVGVSPLLSLPAILSKSASETDDHTDDDAEKREMDNKTRSKERRRRNKDPLLDVIVKGGSKKKGGKKANAVAKALFAPSATPATAQTSDDDVEGRDNDVALFFGSESVTTPKARPQDAPVASTSTSITQKSTKPPPAVFPGPWDEEEALKAQLASSKKDEEMQRSKSRRRDPSILRDSLSLPSVLSQTTPASPVKRSDTPLSNSELSTQTQIASLRGALEAARLREEKSKTDLDKLTKELEAMRWDHAGWRRRELEMQNQIAHLVHQLQSHAALLYHSHAAASAVNTPTSPNNMMGMYQGSPYFPQQPLMSPPPFVQGFPPSNSFPNVLYATSSSSRGGSSDASSEVSTSSSGGSPSMNGNAGERERGRPRTKSGDVGEDWSDAQIANYSASIEPSLSLPLPLSLSSLRRPSSNGDRGTHSSDEENEEDLNNVLADAIFKNPVKFSTGASPTKKRKPEEVEFEYPSLNSGYCPKPQQRHASPDNDSESS